MHRLVRLAFSAVVWIAYAAYKAEGLNGLFLLLPAKMIVPILRRHAARIGSDVVMHSPLIIHNAAATPGKHYSNLQVGNECYFGRDVFLDLADQVIVRDQVTVSMRVTLLTHTHAGNSPLSQDRLLPSYAPIVLEQGCYLGAGVIVLPGVTIGAGAIVGAGAVVTRDVTAGATVVGVPAREVPTREVELATTKISALKKRTRIDTDEHGFNL